MDEYYKLFYKKYSNFNIHIYKKFNKNIIYENNDKNILLSYDQLKDKINIISNINDFYNMYPDFDIFFYKLIYHFYVDNELEYLIHYHQSTNKDIYDINSYLKKNNIDIDFMKIFYKDFYFMENINIILIINNELNNYIVSDLDFSEKYIDFNLSIYKNMNKYILFDNDILYKSYWYHNDMKNNDIIYSIIQFKNIYNTFDIIFFKLFYNIYSNNDNINNNLLNQISNRNENVIYSYEKFINYIDDFDYELFQKDYFLKDLDKINIIEYYCKNIKNIKKNYSKKFFFIKYPDFIEDEFKKFNIEFIKDNIFTIYDNLENKENYIISINDFHKKYNRFDIISYKLFLDAKYSIFFDNENDYKYYWYHNHTEKYYYDFIKELYDQYPTFNLNIYKTYNQNLIDNNDELVILYDFCKKYVFQNLIYSIETFYNKFPKFKIDFYKLFKKIENLNEENTIIYFYNSNCEDIDFDIDIYRSLNKDINNLNDEELIKHFLNYGINENRIYSIKSFHEQYIDKNFDKENIIYWMNKGIYLENDNNFIGRKIVKNIYEVLIDLENIQSKKVLENGISLIIRAKNEELNIEECIESVVDLVDEIIMVDNNSTDNTLELMKKYEKKYKNIKVYEYKINVSRVGIEHTNAIKNKNKNTLGNFYNWCLSKATKYNVFKWDADFICIRNNFIQIIEKYNLKKRNDKFALWFTGKTIFENNNTIYLNYNSFYNEFRIFSYKNNFQWYDGLTCEYTDPYVDSCNSNFRFHYDHPLFYEIKRTSIDEFQERSTLIDSRDINDLEILNNLKNGNNNLIKIEKSKINMNITIFIYTPSLSFGGGNQFIINIYTFYKSFGYKVFIIPYVNNLFDKKYSIILEEDIIDNKLFDINYIKKHNPTMIIYNSNIPFHEEEMLIISHITKNIFVTHSDVAFSNSLIPKYYKYLFKIITVNEYTIEKMVRLLNIDKNIFTKIINYVNINFNIQNNNHKNKKFGVISRFSEDKNIPMFILSLVNVFKKYPDYTCYLIGTNNLYYDNYLKSLVIDYNLTKNILFEGYQTDVLKYYEMFDFIVLPSVSEGASYNIIEAMNIGIPVICSDVGGNHELIKNNKNGILFEYSSIKEFEKNTLYITNYNKQLECIGYIIKNNLFNNQYITRNSKYDKHEAFIPYYLKCKNNICKSCIICKQIYNMSKIFNNNLNIISNSILSIIELDNDIINTIKNNNKLFINNEYNQNIYLNQLLNLL